MIAPFKKAAALLLCVLMLAPAGLLAACGGQPADTGSASDTTADTTPPATPAESDDIPPDSTDGYKYNLPSGRAVTADISKVSAGAHPRIFFTGKTLEEHRAATAGSTDYADMFARLRAECDALLDRPALGYRRSGNRLQSVCQSIQERLLKLCYVYVVTGEEKYADRAWAELESACAFPDWGDDEFIDCAEISYPIALAYDWLYNRLTPEQRSAVENAMLRLSFKPYIEYNDGTRNPWSSTNNWSGVCNGCLGTAAIAFCDVYPEECERILGYVMKKLPSFLKLYAPDGGYPESVDYWDFCTGYMAVFCASLESAAGTDYGIYDSPGFAESAYFPVYMSQGVEKWAIHDSNTEAANTCALPYFAYRSSDTVLLALRRRILAEKTDPESVYDLIYWQECSKEDTDNAVAALPADKFWYGISTAVLRESLDTKTGMFFGLHGGYNDVPHGNLDIGNFVLFCAGYEFICDLGRDNYSLPSYFSSKRNTYYRIRTEGQNTLTVNPDRSSNQLQDATALLVRTRTSDTLSLAVLDISEAYVNAESAFRGAFYDKENSKIVLQDELSFSSKSDVVWSAHILNTTAVRVSTDKTKVRLSYGGRNIVLKLVTDTENSGFEVVGAEYMGATSDAASSERDRSGYSKLRITFNDVTELRCAVVMMYYPTTADMPDIDNAYTIEPMSEWGN